MYTNEDFCILETSELWNYLFWDISKNPHTCTNMRIFATGKFRNLKLPFFESFLKIPIRKHKWGFLPTGKFITLKLPFFESFQKSIYAYTYEDFDILENSEPSNFFGPFLKISKRVHIWEFWLLENLEPWNYLFWAISKNPHTRTHMRIFAYRKIQHHENPKFSEFHSSYFIQVKIYWKIPI